MNIKKPEWTEPTSVLWALLKGTLPTYLLGIMYQQAGVLKLLLHWKKYSNAIKQLVYCRCGFCYDDFPRTREELKGAVHKTLVTIAAEIKVLQKHSHWSCVTVAESYMSNLFDSGRLLGLIPATADHYAYYSESESILIEVEAAWIEFNRNRIM
jgi:hypothetical protein